MPGNYDTYELVGLIEQRKQPLPYYLRRFFSNIMEFESEEILFDKVLGNRRMAPFVSPLIAGKVMRTDGSTMKSFRPAYVKPKQIVRPTEVLKRRPGEPLGGQLSPAQRLQMAIAQTLMDQDDMLDNRLEWMVVQLLKSGAITVAGEDYPTQVVDFGRDANNAVTLLTTARWNDSAPAPLDDIENLSTQMSTADWGAPATEVYMDPNAFKAFRHNADVIAQLDTTRRGTSGNVQQGPQTFDPNEDPLYVGSIGQFDFYVDARQYENEAGAVVPYLTSGEVVLTSPRLDGVQTFGAILDVDAMVAMRSFPKVYDTKDPSATVALTQSAPLPVAKRVNATGYLKVF